MMNKSRKVKICREILHNTNGLVDEKSSVFLLEKVFPGHPEWDEKVGIGIDHIEVRHDGYGGRCFYIVRRDGSYTDISFVASIYTPKRRTDVMRACRTAIWPIIERMRNSIELPLICPITGETIWDRSNIHIDHYNLTFVEVFDEWIKDKDIQRLYEMTLSSNKDNDTKTYFDNEAICRDFIEFHNQHTHLRAVSRKSNISILRKIN